MANKKLKVGIMARSIYVKRTIAIAQGKYKPAKNEPKIFFESLQSMAQVLSYDNQELLRIIIDHNPGSLTELEGLSKRKKSNLSRTLRTLERYGIVELFKEKNKIVPKVKATEFDVSFSLKQFCLA
jgi:predicted transcriptional regulator